MAYVFLIWTNQFAVILLLKTTFCFSQYYEAIPPIDMADIKSNNTPNKFDIYYEDKDSNIVSIATNYDNGLKMMKWTFDISFYNSINKFTLISFMRWYENGQLKRAANFNDMQIDGEHKTYWDNGQLKRLDIHKDGKLISGETWSKEGVKTDYYEYEIMPMFPEGKAAFKQYIANNIDYPLEALEKNIRGKVYVQFVVLKTGEIDSIKIEKSTHQILNYEAIRVIKSSPKWNPGYQDGEPVSVSYTVPIHFDIKNGW